LTFDDAEEVIAFGFSLGCHHSLTFLELSLASYFQLLGLTLLFLTLCDFFFASLTFTFFECTFCSESINFGLTVSSLLLHLSETSYFQFLLFLDASFFFGFGSFASSFFLVVAYNFLVFKNFFLAGLLLLWKGNFVCSFDLSDHLQIAGALFLGCFDFSQTHSFNLTSHLLLFLSKQFTLSDALLLSFLNLVDNNQCSLTLGLLTDDFTFLSYFKSLKSLNLHQQVKFLLFFNPLLFEVFVLLELLIADRYNLGVQNHLIHVLDIIKFFIKLGLCLAKDTEIFISLSNFRLGGGNLLAAFTVHLLHASFSVFSSL
jgi:hypothetical protein